DRAQQAVGARPGGGGALLRDAGPGPAARAALARAPGDADAALPGGDRHREQAHGRRPRAAAVADLGEEARVARAAVLRDRGLVARLHRVGGEAVDLRGSDARVLERGEDRLAGERALGGLEALREGGLPDPDDRRAVLQHAADSTILRAAPCGVSGRSST